MAEEVSLEYAKATFESLLSGLSTADASSFVTWVTDVCAGTVCEAGSEAHYPPDECNVTQSHADAVLRSIVQELTQRVPQEGVLTSEKTYFPAGGPNADMNQETTVHVDAFLFDQEDIDRLCDEGKLSRNYCCSCGSHSTAPLTFISHSSSKLQLKFMFECALPSISGDNLKTKLLVDVGSRLGAVLYGAYLFSPINRIVGVEISEELCKLQQEMVNKFTMSDRIQVKCADISDEKLLLQNADIVILNNVFEFFMPVEEQIRIWQTLQQSISKPGCIIITAPSLVEATTIGEGDQPVVDIKNWVEELSIDIRDWECQCSEDEVDEIQAMFFYQVK